MVQGYQYPYPYPSILGYYIIIFYRVGMIPILLSIFNFIVSQIPDPMILHKKFIVSWSYLKAPYDST